MQPEYISVLYADRDEPVNGFELDGNDDWTLILSNPVDFVADGYKVIRQVDIDSTEKGEDELFAEQVLRLKGADKHEKPNVRIDSLANIMQDVAAHSKLCLLELEYEEGVGYVGIFKSIEGNEVTLSSVTPRGEQDGEMTFDADEIRIIEFGSDYLKSLELVMDQQ